MTAEAWETAAPTVDGPQHLGRGGAVTNYRTGPGDVAFPRDEWMGIDLRDVPHQGVENGRQLFTEIPGPPPEGHGGYDLPDLDMIIDRSTQHQALFWSDWAGSTALQAGGRGSFTGEHVTIVRIPPGSAQGYMPTDPGMQQANNARNLPMPWDAEIILGQGQGAAVSI
jgi:hypothetical protein